MAEKHASEEEKQCLGIIKKRIEEGNLSNLILREVEKRSQKSNLQEAIFSTHSSLIKNLEENKVYS